jgi:hypothetical protein
MGNVWRVLLTATQTIVQTNVLLAYHFDVMMVPVENQKWIVRQESHVPLRVPSAVQKAAVLLLRISVLILPYLLALKGF